MFRAIGVVIILVYLSSQFSQTFRALDRTLATSLGAFESITIVSENKLAK